ncbi:MAG: hypothetical protein AAFR81_08565 [Chloroflexota bacterium]
MQIKKVILISIMAVVLAIGVGSASAHDNGNGEGRPRGFGGYSSELVETYTGLTREELREAATEGVTLAELIEANGESVEAFIADAVAEAETRLDEAVANGNIDAETAEERLATLEENLTERVDQVIGDRDGDGQPDPRPNRRGGRGNGDATPDTDADTETGDA